MLVSTTQPTGDGEVLDDRRERLLEVSNSSSSTWNSQSMPSARHSLTARRTCRSCHQGVVVVLRVGRSASSLRSDAVVTETKSATRASRAASRARACPRRGRRRRSRAAWAEPQSKRCGLRHQRDPHLEPRRRQARRRRPGADAADGDGDRRPAGRRAPRGGGRRGRPTRGAAGCRRGAAGWRGAAGCRARRRPAPAAGPPRRRARARHRTRVYREVTRSAALAASRCCEVATAFEAYGSPRRRACAPAAPTAPAPPDGAAAGSAPRPRAGGAARLRTR